MCLIAYSITKHRLDAKLLELKEVETNLNLEEKDLREHLKFGVFLFKNLNSLFDNSPISIRQKILGSILDEKLIFEKNNYRTPIFKEAFTYINSNINAFKEVKNKTGRHLSKSSRLVHITLLLSNQFIEDLKLLHECYYHIEQSNNLI